MSTMLETAREAIQTPRILDILKELSGYGLGICMPHMHDPDSGEDFSPLPDGLVSYERGLNVTFVRESEIVDAVPVAWMWNDRFDSAVTVGACGQDGHTVSPANDITSV